MERAMSQFVKGFWLAFLAIAISPILALSQIFDAFSSFIG